MAQIKCYGSPRAGGQGSNYFVHVIAFLLIYVSLHTLKQDIDTCLDITLEGSVLYQRIFWNIAMILASL